MVHPNRKAAQFIDDQRLVLAEAIVARQYARQAGLEERYGPAGRAKCVHDTEYHLEYLASAARFASPSLFKDYIAWAQVVLREHGVRLEEVETNLVCMREVLREKVPVDLHAALLPQLDASLETFAKAPPPPPSFLEGDDVLSELARKYLNAALEANQRESIRLIVSAARAGIAVRDLYLRVFQPCQREIGRLWQMRQISVAQEHYCTAATQLAMAQLYPFLFASTKNGCRLVATSVEGELHEVGLRIVTDLFEADGWDTVYLGANLPTKTVVQAVEEHQPDLLLISVTMPFHLPAVENLIGQVRSKPACARVKIMVGGGPFNTDATLWRKVGADGSVPDAADAGAFAAELLNLPVPEQAVLSRYPPKILKGIIEPAASCSTPSEDAAYDELSRLNNELVTAQRELARKNSQLERLNERLIDADQRKDEFLAMLAHELRNPLAPLRNATGLLQQPGFDPSQLERAGAMMERQVQQLGRLVDDLLDLSRIARGKMQLHQEWVELGAAVRRAAEASRPLIESRQHELVISVPQTPVQLIADPVRLEQVLTNLVNNAARYTPEGGRITLAAAREEDQAVIRVRDNGIGIPEEMLEQVFGLFAQVERAHERSGGGLGIGLSLVKSLTEMHGGSVEAKSAGPDQGSEFVVRLPLPTDVTAPPPGCVTKSTGKERAVRVLLVDDNVDAAESLAMLLRLWGHDVAVAHDAPNALHVAERQPPQVALLDIGLPGMDGYELARLLRAHATLKRVMLVALTGWGQDRDRQRAVDAGFDHHLVKPVELQSLQELLSKVPVS